MNEFLELRNTLNAPLPIHYHPPHPWLSSKTDCVHPTSLHCKQTPLLQHTIQIGSLIVSHVTTGIRANNPRITTMPPETRATDLKRIEDSIAAVSQDHSQKYRSCNSRERPHLHSDRVDVRNKELREDRVATYKVQKPKHFFPTFNGGGMYISSSSNVLSISKLKKWPILKNYK